MSDSHSGGSSSAGTPRPGSAGTAGGGKRKKTARACDYCRAHRIRCEYSPEHKGDCDHCVKFGHKCAKVAPAPADKRRRGVSKGDAKLSGLSAGLEPTYLGSSSLTQLVYASCAVNLELSRQLEEFGNRYDHHWDSLRHTHAPGLLIGRDEGKYGLDQHPAKGFSLSRAQSKLNEQVGSKQVLDLLFDTALRRIIPVFPVISPEESCLGVGGLPPPIWNELFPSWASDPGDPILIPPITRLIHWTLASLSREVPLPIRRSLLSTLHQSLSSSENARLAGATTLGHVQTLLLMSMNQDLWAADESTSVSVQWQRTGIGLRMAIELALHRDVQSKSITITQLHRRRRLWAVCVMLDKMYALRAGQPQMINLDDCDAPEAFPYPDHFTDEADAKGPPVFAPIVQLCRLSKLLGRILRLTSSPSGLERTTDVSIIEWQRDVDDWTRALPSTWAASENLPVPQMADIFNGFLISVEFSFLHVFLFPTRPIPPHITFRPDLERWLDLIVRSERVIEWMETAEGQFYLDVWAMMAYPLSISVMAQLHEYRRTNNSRPLGYLERGEQIMQTWAATTTDNTAKERSWKRRMADMVALLRVSAGDHQQYLSIEAILGTIFGQQEPTGFF
ncbi:hypothetical protein IAT38_006413 [Cryptococcus sp. DSM 104549]